MKIKLPLARAKKGPTYPVLKVVTDDITFFTANIAADRDIPTGKLLGTLTATDLWGVEITFSATKLKYSTPYFSVEVFYKSKKIIYCFKPITLIHEGEVKLIAPEIVFGKNGSFEQVEEYINQFSF